MILHIFILLFLTLILNSPRFNKRNNKRCKIQSGGKLENFQNNMLNIYDEPLESCGEENMNIGSWDNNGKCSELGGGVHQICIKNIAKNAKNFSEKTGQSNWSDERGSDNHCVCLGAWALYHAKDKTIRKKNKVGSKKVLKCSAIPKVSLSDDYVSKFGNGWNKWNGLEMDNQIKDGVEALVEDCYNENDSKSEKLKNNYCNFAKKHKGLRNNSKLYSKLCI